jgi:gamma-D-glutamyl-L-lysine dipeptidyl-peptidase
MKSIRVIALRLASALLLSAVASAQSVVPIRTVARPVANMYSSPTADADVVSQAIYATSVTILEERDGWARVATADEYTGWVESPALISRSGEPYGSGKNVVEVRSPFAHIYREDSVSKHAPLLTVPFETRLELDADHAKPSDHWSSIRLPDGRRGVVQDGDIAPAGTILNIDDTIAVGKRLLGVPYTWGGTSSYGYDCSGFTQMLMRQRGYAMPRDAHVQAAWTGLVPVHPSDLRPGDLLFFGSSELRVSHTGMYIGDDLFINATTYEQPMVRVDHLSDPHWARLLVAARRIRP